MRVASTITDLHFFVKSMAAYEHSLIIETETENCYQRILCSFQCSLKI
jgi:hypothetical protein